ncbi:MAG: diguanylate cyclase [Leptolyngbyaceae cyanobacterium SM2_5_2]|nr:diguanylate cyclase [Leptolyngbyaceae cyanobacterium SM2_5_2]
MKILLVEDDASTRELLAFHLSAAHYVVEQAIDGATALELAALWNYDLIILDINLPKLDGMSLCRHLRLQGIGTPILMITAQDDTADVISGLDAGADDYVTKPFEVQRVLARVRALLRRGITTPMVPALTWGDLYLNPTLAQVTYRNQVVPLTPKEYSLLELFLRYPQRVFSRSAILDQLWTIDDSPTEGAVTNLVKDLRNRLKRSGMVDAMIQTVYGLGYRLRQRPDSIEPPAAAPPSSAAVSVLASANSSSLSLATIAARFQSSLQRRVAVLEDAIRSLQAGGLDQQQRQIACDEAHRLAGGLGTFGYDHSSTWAQQIETLFQRETALGPLEVAQLSRCLLALKQSLTTQPVTAVDGPGLPPCCQIVALNLEPGLADAGEKLEQLHHQRLGSWHPQDKTDALAQVANSRHFDAFLRQQWERHRHSQAPLSLILCSPDNFVAYQKTYGSQVSHLLLRHMAHILHHAVNPNIDLVARYDDSHFGLVLPNANLEAALGVVARIQQAISQQPVIHQADHPSLAIALSLGIGSTVPTAANASDHLLKATYQALQDALTPGGNRLCLYSPQGS